MSSQHQAVYRYQGPPKYPPLSPAQFKKVVEQSMYLIWIDKIQTQDPYNVNPTGSESSHASSNTRCISESGGTL